MMSLIIMTSNKSHAKLNAFAYYISQFIWILYILVPFSVSILYPKKTNKAIISSSEQKFNNSNNPIIFAHVTDIHINSLQAKSIISFRKTFNDIKKISPEFVLITGDIVDNYDSTTIPRYGDQNKLNWEIYQNEIVNYNIPIIESFGNHDMFGIKSINSPRNYIINYSKSFTKNNIKNNDDFLIHSFTVGKSKTNIITINPFDFPTSHPPLLLYKVFSNHLLNMLEKKVLENPTKSIVISHYPVGSIHSSKSTSGQKFTDIIGSNSVQVFLSGHSHPAQPEIFHHKNGCLEILGISSLKNSQFGLVAIDNNGITWKKIDNANSQKGIITYPISVNQLSSNAIFNDKINAEIRVVVFSNDKNLKIYFNISQTSNSKVIYSGILNYSRSLENGKSLYTFPIKKCIKDFGSYFINFTGDFEDSREFIIANKAEVGNEKLTEFPRIIEMLYYIFPVFFILLFVITFINPFSCNCCQKYQLKINSIEEWIETSVLNTENSIENWLFTSFLGFLLIRNRFQKISLIMKIYVFFSVIYVLFGPIIFFKTEDLFGFVWLYGYYINNNAIHSDYGVFYSYFYLGIVCTPMIILCSSIGTESWSKYQMGDIIFAIGGLIGDIIVLIRIVHQTSGPELIFSSIGFVIIPVIFIIILLISLIARKNKIHCKNDVGIDNIIESNESSK